MKKKNTTYINITKQIIEATVAVVRGAAQSLENAKPLCTQGATISRQLSTQDPNIVHPKGTLHDMKQQSDKTDRIAVVHTNNRFTTRLPHLSGSRWSTHTSMSTLQTKL